MSNPENVDGNVKETSLENTETSLEYNRGYNEGYAAGRQMTQFICIEQDRDEFHTELSDASFNDLYRGDMWRYHWRGQSCSGGIGYPLRDRSFYKPNFKDDRISSYNNGAIAICSKLGENTSQIAIGLHSSSRNSTVSIAIGHPVNSTASIAIGSNSGYLGNSSGSGIFFDSSGNSICSCSFAATSSYSVN